MLGYKSIDCKKTYMTPSPLTKYLFSAFTVTMLFAPVCAQNSVSSSSATTHPIESSLAETDSKVIRLKSAFTETAFLVKSFVDNKERYLGSPRRLREELSRVTSTYLEPLRKDPEMGKKLTRAQEDTALEALSRNEQCGQYAKAVKKLWDETARTSPLAPRFIAKTIAPDVVPYLTAPSTAEEDTESETGSYTPALLVGGGAILAVALLLALHIAQRKRREQEERERLAAEAEAQRKAKEAEEAQREAEAEAALPTLEEVKNANDYHMEPCIFSTDLPTNVHPLTIPVRKEVKENYQLHVMRSDGQSIQRFAMTKAIMSIGRKKGDDSGHADIALTTDDEYLSGIHGVFMYQHMEDEDSFWLLGINQGSHRNVKNPEDNEENPEDLRGATLSRNGESEVGVAFVVRPGDLIDLTPSTSITIEKKN